MGDYPVLSLILRTGTGGAMAVAVIGAGLIGWSLYPSLGAPAVIIALFLAVVLAVVAAGFVELVKLITNLLLPQ